MFAERERGQKGVSAQCGVVWSPDRRPDREFVMLPTALRDRCQTKCQVMN